MPKGSEKGVVKNKTAHLTREAIKQMRHLPGQTAAELNVSKDTLHKRSKALGFGGWPHRRYRKLGDDEDVNESDSEGDDYDDGGSVCMGTVKVQVMQNGWKELRNLLLQGRHTVVTIGSPRAGGRHETKPYFYVICLGRLLLL